MCVRVYTILNDANYLDPCYFVSAVCIYVCVCEVLIPLCSPAP